MVVGHDTTYYVGLRLHRSWPYVFAPVRVGFSSAENHDNSHLSYEDDANDADWEPTVERDAVYCLCRKPHDNRLAVRGGYCFSRQLSSALQCSIPSVHTVHNAVVLFYVLFYWMADGEGWKCIRHVTLEGLKCARQWTLEELMCTRHVTSEGLNCARHVTS